MSNERKETLYSVATQDTMYIHYDEEHQLARVKEGFIQISQDKLTDFINTAKMFGIKVSNDKYGAEE